MNHKDRKYSYKRSQGRAKPPKQFLLYVEGRNTEKSYFDLLKRSNCKIIPITKRGKGISKCVDFVNDSYKAWESMPRDERDKYDQKWLVFDADGREDFSEGIKLARSKKFGVAFSNMCIEYWFVLHFYDHNGDVIPKVGDSHSAAQIRMINKFIDSYNHKRSIAPIEHYDTGCKRVEEDFFDLLMSVDSISKKSRIVIAFERAKNIHQSKKLCGSEFKESVTTIVNVPNSAAHFFKP